MDRLYRRAPDRPGPEIAPTRRAANPLEAARDLFQRGDYEGVLRVLGSREYQLTAVGQLMWDIASDEVATNRRFSTAAGTPAAEKQARRKRLYEEFVRLGWMSPQEAGQAVYGVLPVCKRCGKEILHAHVALETGGLCRLCTWSKS
ncbi:MAG TPA: hypothetical protein VF546_10535 [Pyrinomonadaceae bacterium]